MRIIRLRFGYHKPDFVHDPRFGFELAITKFFERHSLEPQLIARRLNHNGTRYTDSLVHAAFEMYVSGMISGIELGKEHYGKQ